MAALYDELLKLGKPLDDFGVKAHEQLAKLLERDLGYYPVENALRGNLRSFQKLVVGSGDRHDDLMRIFTKGDGSLAKNEVVSSYEAFKNTTENLGAIETKFPLFKVANIDNIQPELYRAFDSGATVPGTGKTVLDYIKRERKLPPRSAEPTDASVPPTDGHYLGMEKETTPNATKQIYQIDSRFGNDAKLRITVRSLSVKDDCIIPYSANRDASPIKFQIEPVCTDNPVDSITGQSLSGNGRQVTTYTQGEVTTIELWDDSSQAWTIVPFN